MMERKRAAQVGLICDGRFEDVIGTKQYAEKRKFGEMTTEPETLAAVLTRDPPVPDSADSRNACVTTLELRLRPRSALIRDSVAATDKMGTFSGVE